VIVQDSRRHPIAVWIQSFESGIELKILCLFDTLKYPESDPTAGYDRLPMINPRKFSNIPIDQ
jgi:hypothetical protein